MSKTVIIADNHPVFRNGVRQILSETDGFEVLAEVGDGETCVYQAGVLKPDAIVMDLNMPVMGGFEASEAVLKVHPACRIVILSMYSSAEFVARAREIGCHGFVAKEDAGEELVKAISGNSGGFFMSSSTGRAEEDVLGEPDKARDTVREQLSVLTAAEHKVLRQIAAGLSSGQIAERNNLSVRTIHSHRQNICRKLGLSGINSLIRFASEHRSTLETA